MNTKEDIIKGFLMDLEEYNKVFKKIEKSEELFDAITKGSKMSNKDFNQVYVDFKINHTELLLDELQKFVDDMEKKYAWLNDSWTLIDTSKRELGGIKYSKYTDFDKTINRCDVIIKKIYSEYDRLRDNQKKLIRNGLTKFLIFYGSVCAILSVGGGFLLWDRIKSDIGATGFIWIILVVITWNIAKSKFWRKE